MEKTERVIAIFRLISLVLTAILLCGTSVAHAETAVGGAIVANTTWSAAQGPYLVTADVSVESGAVLSVEAGVTVRFQTGRRLIIHNGALRVAGTAATPVTLTSALNIPTGTPAAGDWGGVQFLDGTVDAATLVEHLTISYGSTTAIFGASPTFNNCRFEHNSGYAISIDLASYPHGSGNSAIGNGVNAIQVPAGEMTTSGIWDFTAIPYFLDGIVSVGAAPTLSGVTPSSIEQSSVIDATILGTRLNGATRVLFGDPTVTAAIQAGGTPLSLPVKITASAMSVLGLTGITVSTPAGDVSLPSALTVTPPLPAITAVTPDTLFVSRPTTTITIAGSNFSTDSVVYLAGSALTTTFVSSTRLEASVPPQTIAEIKQVQVKNPDPRNLASYLVSNNASFTVVVPQFTLTPATDTVRQGLTDTLTLSIPFAAPVGGITANLVSTNVLAATVPATITIPEGSTSVALSVSAPDTTNSHDVILEIHANQNNWTGTKSTITVRPEPTVNLSPVTLLSGQGSSFFLGANLTDPAPVGGLVVALAATPAGVVTLPASITVPEGAVQAQVTVTNSGTGTTVITGTPAVGKGFAAGDSSTVTVRPIQTTNITPLVSQQVGVKVETALPPNGRDVTYSPLLSRSVGVVSGPIVTGISPNRAPIGTQNLLVRVNGSGFAADSSIAISPTLLVPTPISGVTLRNGTLAIALDGSYIEFGVDIAGDAQISDRIITVTSGGKVVPPATADANRFKVTWPAPELWSLVVNTAVVNTSMTLQLSGKNFQGATSIAVEPPQGILIGSPISISADGTSATVPVFIAADAAPGNRAVWISTPGGNTAATIGNGNVLTILAVPGTTYSPLVSRQVGVTVTPASTTTSRDVPYGPVVSPAVGIALGSFITGVSPVSGAIGTINLPVRITGVGLSAVDSIAVEPNTGLTITRPDPPVAADGTWVDALVTIAADAPLTQRVVILKAGTAVIPAVTADANRFRVTLPMPQMTSMFPLRSKAGSTFTLTVNGRLLNGATAISFLPPDGISVSAPTVASDGNSATATVTITAAAAPGVRAVTITTPGGTTSSAVTIPNETTPTINAFEVIVIGAGEQETTYSPVVSRQVGVTVTTAPLPVDHQVNYGPVVSNAVGVSIPLPDPVASRNVTYTPIISRPVGIAVGAVMTGMSPAAIEPGTTKTVTFTGKGLDAITSIDLYPADAGLTFGALQPAADGLSLTVDITAAAAVPRAPRMVVLKTAAGAVSTPIPGANILYTGKKPSIASLNTISIYAGNTFVLTINGNDLDAATRVRFVDLNGIDSNLITIANPPVINAGGTIASVTVFVDGMATGGNWNVIVEGPYGSSGNSIFTVMAGLVPASGNNVAAVLPHPRTTLPVTGIVDSSKLTARQTCVLEAIPTMRNQLESRTADSVGVSWFAQDDVSRSVDLKVDHEPVLLLLAQVGWGYRAPPSSSLCVA